MRFHFEKRSRRIARDQGPHVSLSFFNWPSDQGSRPWGRRFGRASFLFHPKNFLSRNRAVTSGDRSGEFPSSWLQMISFFRIHLLGSPGESESRQARTSGGNRAGSEFRRSLKIRCGLSLPPFTMRVPVPTLDACVPRSVLIERTHRTTVESNYQISQDIGPANGVDRPAGVGK